MDELYEIRVDFDKDEYIKNELEITEQSVIELKEYLSESNYEKISYHRLRRFYWFQLCALYAQEIPGDPAGQPG